MSVIRIHSLIHRWLEAVVLAYDFGIFVFTPDDETFVSGEVKHVARDNVVFELGLFVGKPRRT